LGGCFHRGDAFTVFFIVRSLTVRVHFSSVRSFLNDLGERENSSIIFSRPDSAERNRGRWQSIKRKAETEREKRKAAART
jgi:hypothetical protein